MGIAALQAFKVGTYIFKQKFKGNRQYPLVLMLEPLFRCNLACVGCGKIQYPGEILKKNMTPEQAFKAIDECGAPVVTIAGGEPLMHPEIDVITKGMIARKKFVYLCTNAILLEKNLHRFEPSPYLTFNVHLDGMRERHDHSVDRKGIFDVAISAIKKAKAAGFRVNTNTTVFDGETPADLHEMFDMLTELGVDGMTIAPGYGYEKAPDQDHFLTRQQTNELFKQVLAPMASSTKMGNGKKWQFNQSPLYLKFLMGEIDYECTPWGSPNYNIFGWQKPCYMFSDGYAQTFREYLETTDWSKYGRKSGNPKCQDCMMHCGHEPTAAIDATSSLRGMLVSIKGLA